MYDVLGPSGGISALISSVKKMKTECGPKTTPIKPKKGKEVQDPNYVLIGELYEGPIHVYTYRVIDDSTGNYYCLFNMNLTFTGDNLSATRPRPTSRLSVVPQEWDYNL